MKLFNTFAQKAPNRVFISIIVGALAGVCYSALIPLVLSSISPKDDNLSVSSQNVETIFSVDVIDYNSSFFSHNSSCDYINAFEACLSHHFRNQIITTTGTNIC